MTDPVANMLSKIKNAYSSRHQSLEVPHSAFKEKITTLLVKEGFLKKTEVEKKDGKKVLKISLLYKGKNPALVGAKIFSKSSLKIYVKAGKFKEVLGGTGINVVSTSKGLMTGQQAEKRGLGGELICQIW